MAAGPAAEILGNRAIDARDRDLLQQVMRKTDTEEMRTDGRTAKLSPDEVATAMAIICGNWTDVLRVAQMLQLSAVPLAYRDLRRAMEKPQGADIAGYFERWKKAAVPQRTAVRP